MEEGYERLKPLYRNSNLLLSFFFFLIGTVFNLLYAFMPIIRVIIEITPTFYYSIIEFSDLKYIFNLYSKS